jgi:hypothetical protein
MTREQLETIIQDAPNKLRENLGELEDKILEAAAEALSATQDSDDGGNPKARVSLKLVIDLSQSPPVWHTEGAVSISYKVKSDAEQCDDTPELMPAMGKGKAGKAVAKFVKVVEDLRKEGVTMTVKGDAA